MNTERRTVLAAALAGLAGCALPGHRPAPIGETGVVIERATGSVQIVHSPDNTQLGRIEGLGDLSHAAVVFSPDRRHAFVFGRDGGLSKLDVVERRLVARSIQAGNSIGGAISKDGRILAVANYEPGGVKFFDATTLALLSEVPSTYGNDGRRAKVVGIADAPGNRFAFSLFDADAIWVADLTDPRQPVVTRHERIGRQPYDGLITQDGRYYIAGLFGEDGLALLDLSDPAARAVRILDGYGRGAERLPVYKMPHLRGWAAAGPYLFLPAIGKHEVLVVERASWREVGRIPVHGQPVFVMAKPGGDQVWVNFAFPLNDKVQVIDVRRLALVETLSPGRAIMHMEFTRDGSQAWVSARDDDRLVVFDTRTFARRSELVARSPSGIFFDWRAAVIGM
jgi:protein NirF